jgi:hypothetical protein
MVTFCLILLLVILIVGLTKCIGIVFNAIVSDIAIPAIFYCIVLTCLIVCDVMALVRCILH